MAERPLSRERWAVLEPLLDAALGLDVPERHLFLDDACGSDSELRAEMQVLLVACEDADRLMPAPAAVAYAPLLEAPSAPLPEMLGDRYHIVREIDRGGMATVYLADDPKHARQVAVKVLHADVARAIGRERFLREIEIAARLSHPHILPLHDSGAVTSEHDGVPAFLYFVSPYVAGESLRDRLVREPKPPLIDVLRIGHEVAQALDYAHRQGVVHLDVKPGNILLQEGHAVIADFGIARGMPNANGSAVDAHLPLLGTPSYMSPEQALGTLDVDARSDVYSLGCVLHEMLAGERPSEMGRLEHVPRAVADIVERALAPSRGERFASAAEMAQALSDAMQPRTRLAWPKRRVAIAIGALVAVAAAVIALAVDWPTRATPLDADLIAVAPFDVESPSLALWKEGLVDVLSRNLDGAGPLRTVPASVIVQQWQGRADVPSARALGASTGARYVLYGGVLAGGDSVRATLVLLDARTGARITEIEQRDVASRMDRVADSLTVAVLREIGRERRIDVARATSSPTTSLAALKAYLQGEQFYRAARWDSAQTHFARAIALDTTFALAYHRLGAVRRWRDASEVPDTTTYRLMQRTSRFAHGLAPRERVLATVDSLSAAAYFAGKDGWEHLGGYARQQAYVRELYARLTDALHRYPSDAELRFLYADARAQFDPLVTAGELDDRATLEVYDRAIALDSSFAPGYVKPIALSAYLDGAASATRYIHAYLARAPDGPRAQGIRLADALLDPARASTLDIARLVDTLPPDGLCQATALLRHVPDANETVVRIARALASRTPTDTRDGAPCGIVQAIEGLQFRGHLREAYRLANERNHWQRPLVLYNLAQFGMMPVDTTRASFQYILSLAPRLMLTKMMGWWATDRDTLALATYATQYAVDLRKSRTARSGGAARANIAATLGYLALAHGDTTGAIRQLTTTPDSLYECWHEARLTAMRLLVATHRYAEAARLAPRRWPGTTTCNDGVSDVLWTMQRARVFDHLGRHTEAIENYAFVADVWRSADPELQPYVRESRAAMARLAR